MSGVRPTVGALIAAAGLAGAVAGVYADTRAAAAAQMEILHGHELALDDQRRQTARVLDLLADIRERLVRV